jgi:FlaA1/EpsC-like NDP-sugar epimerase
MPDSDKQPKTENSDNIYAPLPKDELLKYRRLIIIGAHIAAFAFSLLLSFLVTFNMQFRSDWLLYQYPQLLAGFIIVKLIVFAIFNQFRGWWRYAGISDLISIGKASLVSTLIIVILWFISLSIPEMRRALSNIADVSQGVFILDMFFTILLLGGLRMLVRLYYEEYRREESGHLKRFLIIGAGNAGEALLREIHRMPVAQYEVVGFVDDDPAKHGMSIHDISVLGTVDQLPQICKDNEIEEIAIAMPSATHQQLRRVIQTCQGTKIRFRTVPSITDIATGKFKVSQIRDVDINDLLGREVVQLDLELIEEFIKNKVILVTGAGGSIGSEMCRQVCYFKPALLLLVEQAENALFFIERELRQDFPDVPMQDIICDITDEERVNAIFDKYHPQIVIHAAAHKHVPLMEINPGEAVKNNIKGTRTVADAADRYGSTNFVMISTDKAVNPTSIMGSTKRVAEMYIQDLNRTSKTDFVTVRFGNVLGSNGSVVPIFKAQIAKGGPVTVTHPDMRRYFMTIPEASQLVLQAASMGKGGEIFVLDMGEPVKIVDLARELITLSGFRPGEDIEIAFTGLRPGEKLFEELSITGENMLATRHPKIGVWQNLPMDRQKLREGIDRLMALAQSLDRDEIVEAIKSLVPEYIGNGGKTNNVESSQ